MYIDTKEKNNNILNVNIRTCLRYVKTLYIDTKSRSNIVLKMQIITLELIISICHS